MYKCEHFAIYELVPESYYKDARIEEDLLWMLFDQRGLITIDRIRKIYGRSHINTYYFGGDRNLSGLRPFNCNIGAIFSQHKFAKAFDMIFDNYTAQQVRSDILRDPWSKEFEHIMGIELNVSWLHIDFRNWDKQQAGLYQFGA